MTKLRSGRKSRSKKTSESELFQKITFRYPASQKNRNLRQKALLSTLVYMSQKKGDRSYLFYPLNAKVMMESIGRNYRKELDELVEDGIIEERRQYQVGKKSRHFRITPKILDEDIIFETTNANKGVSRLLALRKRKEWNATMDKLMELSGDSSITVKRMAEIDCYLMNSLKKTSIKENADIDSLVFEARDKWTRKIKRDKNGNRIIIKKKGRTNPKLSKEAVKYGAQKIVDKDFFFSSDKNGRKYNNWTSINKKIRPMMSFSGVDGGEDLVELDMINSQANLLFSWLEYSVRKDEENPNSALKSKILFFSSYYQSLQIPSRSPSYMIENEAVKCKDRKDGQDRQVVFPFQSNPGKIIAELEQIKVMLSEDGKSLYKMLAGKLKIEVKEAKTEFFKMVFTNAGGQCVSKVGQLFRKEYPAIFKYLLDIKNTNPYELIANNLQQIESHFLFFNIIYNKIMKIKENPPVITIHDSLIIPRKYEESAKRCFAEAFEEIGIIGGVKSIPLSCPELAQIDARAA